ncbi:PepSY domain-containing protein [Novosphingobium sp. MMS21-SN21R]|uniref:PepSY-associated TM helix domain-containing protein n=1 Tax=Novosphingobium sp. MMS21-SN21R TaxID=2969298 RepID=UPI0028851D7D|nr:PepSY domain-containing protein [Novosphingobium sp. MMS21-SN21R]MDT0508376.1 PepSY domain-containing protein [Novosphingobium sp. MMS21-SN21R]
MSVVLAGTPARYRTIWRWHFYAALFVMPMVVLLSITGAIYLFKPQVEAWEERSYAAFPMYGAVSPDDQVEAALEQFPGARFHTYRLPREEGDAALVHIGLPNGEMRDVFVSPQGDVLGALDPQWRIMQVVHDIHGQLLLGPRGSWLVELAASWAIVMILSGLYLWWPRGRGLAGVLWPRLHLGSRAAWRDVHAVTGFWVSGLAFVLLVTGLPWADVWGSAFKAVRAEMGWQKGVQDWTIGGRAPAPDPAADEHAEHNHGAMMAAGGAMDHSAMGHTVTGHTGHGPAGVFLTEIVAKARGEHLPFPVIVSPPGAPAKLGQKAKAAWTVRSDTQNRPLRVSITFDAKTGREITREGFAEKHPIDRVIGYGVAWHEGQLFGWINQAIGVLTALMLVAMSITGFVMWRRRKPAGMVGAPPQMRAGTAGKGVWVALCVLAALLPLLALSLAGIFVIERAILKRIPKLSAWLGL